MILWQQPVGDGEFLASTAEFPNVTANAKTADACVKQLRASIAETIIHAIERGMKFPGRDQGALG
jgi:predicted RNase H-like HicB family nuclease